MTERYSEDGQLSILTKQVLDTYEGRELDDAKTFQWRVLFTTQRLGHEEVAGKCVKVDGAVRYLWSNDFIILIQRQSFDSSTDLEKVRILVHELRHIGKNEHDEPSIRRHEGDFCEIPAHDKLSFKIAGEIHRNLPALKAFTRQIEVATA